jgi:heme a synthase
MNARATTSRRFFARFAFAVLLYNLPVILWGAYVRVSFSGDGCGANWPTCNGQIIPQAMAAPMAIEFTHRAMTSVDTIAVLALVVWAFFAFPKKHAVRRYASFSLIFLLIEALLGAGLVLFRYVAKDQSAGRIWYLSAHLTNTMLLLAALTITAWLAYSGRARLRLFSAPKPLLFALALTIFVSISGAITALGDTLFPASSLAAGVRSDFAASAALLLRLRVLHPAIAIAGALYLVWIALRVRLPRVSAAVLLAVFVQVAAGMLNLLLLAPLSLQLIHLLLADLLWIAVVWLVLDAVPRAPDEAGFAAPASAAASSRH